MRRNVRNSLTWPETADVLLGWGVKSRDHIIFGPTNTKDKRKFIFDLTFSTLFII